MTLRLITAPSTEPVTLAEVKANARVDGTEFDSMITLLIQMAREYAESETGRAFITQTWELVIDAFPEKEIKIEKLPISSITYLKYYDENGTLQTLDSDDYVLDANVLPGWVLPAYNTTWPTTYDVANAVIVRFVAGYGAAADVPASIRQWIILRASTMVDMNRSINTGNIVTDMPRDYVDAMLDPYRLHW
jgi:uncharacterized phiE125 gp8 family phage protein